MNVRLIPCKIMFVNTVSPVTFSCRFNVLVDAAGAPIPGYCPTYERDNRVHLYFRVTDHEEVPEPGMEGKNLASMN